MDLTFDSIFSLSYQADSGFHDFHTKRHELIYFINGKGDTEINEKRFEYSANSICFTKTGDIRSHNCVKKTDYICVRFLGNFVHEYLKSGVYSNNNKDIFSAFTDVQKEWVQKKTYYFELCNLKIAEIIINITRQLGLCANDQKIYDLLKMIDENRIFNMTVQEMADTVSYSYDYFRHRFKKVTGQSPVDYIINKRVENACQLLRQNEHSCTEISQMCGFATPAQFSLIFRKKTGLLPKNFKDRSKSIFCE